MICLYKSWGNPTGDGKPNLNIPDKNDIGDGEDKLRYVHQRQERPLPDGPQVAAFKTGPDAINNAVGNADGYDEEHESRMDELHSAKKQILELERKIQELEGRIPRKYPDVTFLNYKNRKRILVSLFLGVF